MERVSKKEVSVVNRKGETVDTVPLAPDIFDVEPNQQILYEDVKAYLENKRQGTACTKGRSEVRGGGSKPWRQKGTGRARAGTSRSPLWIGGGVVFGPKPKSYRNALPKKMKRLARRSAFSIKARGDEILIVDDLTFDEPKTKGMVSVLNLLGIGDKKVLFLTAGADANLLKSCRNIPNVTVKPARDVPAYDVLNCEVILMTRHALAHIEEVLGT
ncbi:MAG: 50S ribosomal protein L4 [Gemmatimonadota bacterium]|nr:MAG: 50S ribosomal protein L4 [Gemmatimonadota bacterium]